ncbi:MAG: PIN domain-containing protein [Gaiellaceae bacterium]
MELADTSAWTSRHRSPDTLRAFAELVDGDEIATCAPVVFELLRSEPDHGRVVERRDQLEGLRTVPIGPRVWRRALDVQERLAGLGPSRHRPFPLADLLVAAAAELAELPVLHYDRHFELIASVTGQPVRALAPLGSL